MTGEALSVIAANLSALSGEASSVIERRFAHLYGLARSIGGEMSDALRCEYEEIIGLLQPHGEGQYVPPYFGRLVNRADRIALCSFIYECLGEGNSSPTPEQLLGYAGYEGEDEAPNRICYLHNYYSDKAYGIFSELLDSPTVMYQTDFTSVCEDVYYGRAKYCILPVENSADGMLSGFRTLIGKYELSYALSCDVSTQDGEAFTRFALLRRGISSTLPARGEHVFEFSATFDDGGAALCDVLDAAESYGLKLRQLNLLPASYSGRSGMYDLAFNFGDKGLAEFIVFLALEVPQFEALGIYTHIGVKV